MTRTKARKWLFVSIAITMAVFILREPLATLAEDAVGSIEGARYFGDSWALMTRDFFEQRWALALSAMAVVYFAYRFISAASEDSN